MRDPEAMVTATSVTSAESWGTLHAIVAVAEVQAVSSWPVAVDNVAAGEAVVADLNAVLSVT